MEILIIDNYDSFTYNLKHDLERVEDVHVTVMRNDEIDWQTLHQFDRFVLSPGPGVPSESGDLLKFIRHCELTSIPVLGVCLGLQALVEHTGGSIYNLGDVRHGISFNAEMDIEDELYQNLPPHQKVGLYHSWAANEAYLPAEWKITSKSVEGIIMSIRHSTQPWVAVQYHPESILTEYGRKILENWLAK